jgi:hypothetical protein
MHLNHSYGWFVELKGLNHSRKTGQELNYYYAIRNVYVYKTI